MLIVTKTYHWKKIAKRALIPKIFCSVNAMKKLISKLIGRQDVDYNLFLRVLGGAFMLYGSYFSKLIKVGKKVQFQHQNLGFFLQDISNVKLHIFTYSQELF